MHTPKSAQTQYKTDDQNKYWVFPDFIFRIASMHKKKKTVQLT